MMVRPGLVPGLVAAAVAVLSLALAACGGGAAPSAATQAPTVESADTGTAQPQELVAQDRGKAQEAAAPERAVTGRTGREKLVPELRDVSGWINTEPFTLESLRGQVVLVDFWTYTCVNCIRTFPYLKDWHRKYADKGLAIVGVHTPEFDFEKDRDNVVKAVQEFGLKYRIVQDNDYGTWNAFRNQFWPSKYLVDKDGYIRFSHFGEGAYEETEGKIRELLKEAGADLSVGEFETLAEPEYDPAVYTDDPTTSLTRELYAGYERNYAALQFRTAPPYVRHPQYYTAPDVDLDYEDPGRHENHFVYLSGLWRNAAESIIHARETQDYEDYIAIVFYASTVNAVMSRSGSDPVMVRVTLDEKPLDASQAGVDIEWAEDGSSYVLVDESRLYNVIKIPSFDSHEIKLSSNSEGFALYAFTFGAFLNPDRP